ncbi:MAG: thioester reductase domain-containing protein [Pseudomonadota bacterium]
MDYKNISTVKNILLTGTTGVLGARILQELLITTDAYIYCLMRDESYEIAFERIQKLLFVYDEDRKLLNDTWRIIPVLGDLAKDHLGMEDDVYKELYESIDLVMHCAANVSLIASYDSIVPVNVDGTKRVINFCINGDIPLFYASSFSVIGDMLYEEEFIFSENQLDVGQKFQDMCYERSKFESEKLLHEATESGLNWVVGRPGNIWGDSQTGCYPLNETKVKGIYYEMIKSLVETGYSFSSDENFDVTTVDYVAKACIYMAFNIHITNRKTYHLTNPNKSTYNDIIKYVSGSGYVIRHLSDDDYFTALYEDRMIRNGEVYDSTFTNFIAMIVDEDSVEEKAVHDTTSIQQLLENTDIDCPELDQKMMNTFLKYCVKKELISSVESQSPLAEIQDEMDNKIYMQHLYDEEFDEDMLFDGMNI